MEVLDLILFVYYLPDLAVDFILAFWQEILVSLIVLFLVHFGKTILPIGWRDIF